MQIAEDGTREVRLGAKLTFDKKEVDLALMVEELTKQHKLGKYINDLLRYAWENPEQFKGTEIDVSKYGVSDLRQRYFNALRSDVDRCKEIVKYIYREMLPLSAAVKSGVTFGIVEKTDDFLLTIQCVEHYIDGLSKILGYDVREVQGSCSKELRDDIKGITSKATEDIINLLIAKGVDLRIQQAVGNGVTQNGSTYDKENSVNHVVDSDSVNSSVGGTNVSNKISNNVVRDEFTGNGHMLSGGIDTGNVGVGSGSIGTTASDVKKYKPMIEPVDDLKGMTFGDTVENVEDEEDDIDLISKFCGLL